MREEIANASELIKGNIDDLTIIDREKNSRLIDLFSRMTKLMDCVVLNYDTFSEQDITDFNYVIVNILVYMLIYFHNYKLGR